MKIGELACRSGVEIAGCYLVYLWLRQNASAWLLVPAAASLGLFAFLLTLHPAAAGRTYAAFAGAAIAIGGMALIVLQPAR
jgi:small multidrug resistance family-3 protein